MLITGLPFSEPSVLNVGPGTSSTYFTGAAYASAPSPASNTTPVINVDKRRFIGRAYPEASRNRRPRAWGSAGSVTRAMMCTSSAKHHHGGVEVRRPCHGGVEVRRPSVQAL